VAAADSLPLCPFGLWGRQAESLTDGRKIPVGAPIFQGDDVGAENVPQACQVHAIALVQVTESAHRGVVYIISFASPPSTSPARPRAAATRATGGGPARPAAAASRRGCAWGWPQSSRASQRLGANHANCTGSAVNARRPSLPVYFRADAGTTRARPGKRV